MKCQIFNSQNVFSDILILYLLPRSLPIFISLVTPSSLQLQSYKNNIIVCEMLSVMTLKNCHLQNGVHVIAQFEVKKATSSYAAIISPRN